MTTNLDTVCHFVSETADRPLQDTARDLAKQCLIDWFAVTLAARSDAAPSATRQLMQQWATRGRALNLYGDAGAPGPTALVNGTLSHALDFDDMHFRSAYHATGPTMAAALAIAMDRGCSEAETLKAFVTGYEVGAAMGESGVGLRLLASGWHATGILGHFSSVSAAAALLRLSPEQIAHAFGLAATQAAGLQASGGTMAKPFHVGKAAMNGVMAAELAMLGMDASNLVFDEPKQGVLGSLLQEPLRPRFDVLGDFCRLEGNTFKPYASCQLTHAPFEAASALSDEFSHDGLKEIRAYVNPLAPKVARIGRATTSLEAKFSIPYCVALGLKGGKADMSGFTETQLENAGIQALSALVRVHPAETVERWAAQIELDYGDGKRIRGETHAVKGSPSRPLTAGDLDEKFLVATAPILGDNASRLLDVLHQFEEPGSLAEVSRIITESRRSPCM